MSDKIEQIRKQVEDTMIHQYGDALVYENTKTLLSHIDELEGVLNLKNDEYVQQVGAWKIIQRLEESEKKLEQKLAKAKSALEFYSKPHENGGAYVGQICFDRVQGNDCEVIGAFSIAGRLARTTLAEIGD